MAVTKVVILNWNGADHLSQFLPSVLVNTSSEVEVLVADNGSTDNSREWLAANYPDVGVIELSENYGFAGGYNRALSSSKMMDADYFVLLNSDVETPKGWCEPLIDFMECNIDVAAVAPKILSYIEKDKFEYAGASGGFIDGLGYPFCRGRILSTIEQDRGQYNDSRDVFWATGACMMIRAEVWRELEGLDEAFFAHMEEIDFCWRAQNRGYRIAVEPQSKVFHLGGGTLSATNPHKSYLNFRNNLAMMYKNLTSRSMPLTIFTRMALDGFSAIVYLVTGKPKLFKAVFRAHIDFWKWRPRLKSCRAEIQKTRRAKPAYIYRNSILLRYLFGLRRFSEMM